MTPLGDPPESIQSGNYGNPPKSAWWLKQSLIYFFGLLGMKFCVFVLFQVCPWLINVGDWALRWTEGNEMVQVFFVMLLFPLIMNALQYYIIDGFIKNQKPSDHEPIPSDDGGDRRDTHEEDDVWDASVVGGETPDLANTTSAEPTGKRGRVVQAKLDEYDERMDGDETPTAVGSGSGSEIVKKDEEEPLLPEEADPSAKKARENLR